MLVTIYVRTCLAGKTEVLIHGFLRFSSLNSIALRAVILTHFSRLGEEVSLKTPNFRVNQAGIIEIFSLMYTGL